MHGRRAFDVLGRSLCRAAPARAAPRAERWSAHDTTLERDVVVMCLLRARRRTPTPPSTPPAAPPASTTTGSCASSTWADPRASRSSSRRPSATRTPSPTLLEQGGAARRGGPPDRRRDRHRPRGRPRARAAPPAADPALGPARPRRHHQGAPAPATAAGIAGDEDLDDVAAARADAVGVVALTYAALTSRWPLPGRRPRRWSPPRTSSAGCPRPSEIAAGVPGDLDALCRLTLNDDAGPAHPRRLRHPDRAVGLQPRSAVSAAPPQPIAVLDGRRAASRGLRPARARRRPGRQQPAAVGRRAPGQWPGRARRHGRPRPRRLAGDRAGAGTVGCRPRTRPATRPRPCTRPRRGAGHAPRPRRARVPARPPRPPPRRCGRGRPSAPRVTRPGTPPAWRRAGSARFARAAADKAARSAPPGPPRGAGRARRVSLDEALRPGRGADRAAVAHAAARDRGRPPPATSPSWSWSSSPAFLVVATLIGFWGVSRIGSGMDLSGATPKPTVTVTGAPTTVTPGSTPSASASASPSESAGEPIAILRPPASTPRATARSATARRPGCTTARTSRPGPPRATRPATSAASRRVWACCSTSGQPARVNEVVLTLPDASTCRCYVDRPRLLDGATEIGSSQGQERARSRSRPQRAGRTAHTSSSGSPRSPRSATAASAPPSPRSPSAEAGRDVADDLPLQERTDRDLLAAALRRRPRRVR